MNRTRTFTLSRPSASDDQEHVTVAHGAVFPDGTTVVRWPRSGTGVYDTFDDVPPTAAGYDGALTIRFDDVVTRREFAPRARHFDRVLQDMHTPWRSIRFFDQNDGSGVTFDDASPASWPTTLSNDDVESLRDQLSEYLADVTETA